MGNFWRAVDTTEITSWKTSAHPILSPHGVFNSAEFYGYYDYDVGTLNQTDKGGNNPVCAPIQIHFKVKLNEEATNDIKIHLDAYGCEGAGPYSHDATILQWPDIPTLVVPEVLFGTAAAVVASMFALMLSKRRLSMQI